MIFTSKDILPLKEKNKSYYFLAGSMDFNSGDSWREKVVNELKESVCIFDPTRIEHNDFSDAQMKEHIEWELDALALSDRILLNLLPSSKSPISLVELGLYVESAKLIVVCPESFYQRRYIETICNKYDTVLFDNLDEGIEYIKTPD